MENMSNAHNNVEQGVTLGIQTDLKERLKSLHIEQQHLQQTTQALCSSSNNSTT